MKTTRTAICITTEYDTRIELKEIEGHCVKAKEKGNTVSTFV